MITQFKIFENNMDYREVDLKQFYKNMFTYRKELGYNFSEIQSMFEYQILPKLLNNKHIEFQKVINPIDSDVTFNEEGVVEWAKLDQSYNTILIKLWDDDTIWQLTEKASQVVKIYNSKPLDIEIDMDKYEEERRMKKEVDKYNL